MQAERGDIITVYSGPPVSAAVLILNLLSPWDSDTILPVYFSQSHIGASCCRELYVVGRLQGAHWLEASSVMLLATEGARTLKQ